MKTGWLLLEWGLFLAAFVWGHLRTRSHRGRSAAAEQRVHRDRSSDAGMALQFAALFGVFYFFVPLREPLLPWAIAVMGAGVALLWWSIHHLGRQWRLQAVATDDHELIRTGPYAYVRHPLYVAFFAAMLGWAMAKTGLLASAAAVLVFAVGTEIRVRAEDAVLAAAFPREFPAYRASVAAYFPGLR